MVKRSLNVAFGGALILFALLMAGVGVWAVFWVEDWSIAIVAIIFTIFSARAGWLRIFPSTYDPLPIEPDDALFLDAKARARREVGRLRRGLADGGKEAYVKFPAQTQSGAVEHIWALVHSLEGNRLTVSIINEPVEPLKDDRPRQSVMMDLIEDWMLVHQDGVTEGGFTHLAMAKKFRQVKGYLPSSMKRDLRSFKDLDVSDF